MGTRERWNGDENCRRASGYHPRDSLGGGGRVRKRTRGGDRGCVKVHEAAENGSQTPPTKNA